jgi:hypothetical protein
MKEFLIALALVAASAAPALADYGNEHRRLTISGLPRPTNAMPM